MRARDLHERLGDNQEADDLVELILRTCSLDDICSVKAVSTRFTNVGRRIVHSKMWRTNNVFSLAPKIWADGPYLIALIKKNDELRTLVNIGGDKLNRLGGRWVGRAGWRLMVRCFAGWPLGPEKHRQPRMREGLRHFHSDKASAVGDPKHGLIRLDWHLRHTKRVGQPTQARRLAFMLEMIVDEVLYEHTRIEIECFRPFMNTLFTML